MTQRAVFTKDMIVEAAFQLTRETGWQGVTARNVAARLGSSTMPLYSSLKSMDEIEKAVRARAQQCMQDYQKKAWSPEPLLASAVGYVAFARDEKNLFRFLYVDRPVRVGASPGDGGEKSVEELRGVVDLADQAAVAMKDHRVLKSWAFTHGLASLISSGVIDLPDETIARLLLEAGSAIYAGDSAAQPPAPPQGGNA